MKSLIFPKTLTNNSEADVSSLPLKSLLALMNPDVILCVRYPKRPQGAITALTAESGAHALQLLSDSTIKNALEGLIVTSIRLNAGSIEVESDYKESFKNGVVVPTTEERIEQENCTVCKEKTFSNFGFCDKCGHQRADKHATGTQAQWIDEEPKWFAECSNCFENGFTWYTFCPWCGSEMNGVIRK
ncbi:MAG: hypothetical protein LBC86_07350 [Oscillospiraceae bacterium]|jgi:hypothetical protein|nr:hypothetical protein [Oscillospiraceae bacterium]